MKLDWCREYRPDELQDAKDMILKQVRMSYLFKAHFETHLLIPVQIRPYYSHAEPPATNSQPAAPAASDNRQPRSAAGILGLGRPKPRSALRTLEAEVEIYLNDPQEGKDSLSFWQV